MTSRRQTSIKTYKDNSSDSSNLPLEQRVQQVQLIQRPKKMELLNCMSINMQVKTHGREPVEFIVKSALSKLAISMFGGIDSNKLAQIEILTEDLVDAYSYDSIEDLVEAIRKGRQNKDNKYPNPYNRFNMDLICSWVNTHLGDKADARQEALKQQGQTPNEKYPDIDYAAFKKRTFKHKTVASDKEKEAALKVSNKRELVGYYTMIKSSLGYGLCSTKQKEIEAITELLRAYGKSIKYMSEAEVANVISEIKKEESKNGER